MTRPNPVVGVASEFTNGRGRCANQTYVAVNFVQVQEVLVAVIGGVDSYRIESFVQSLQRSFRDALYVIVYNGLAFFFVHRVCYTFQNLLCNVFHAAHESDGQAFVGQFFCTCACPKAVFQVVVFYGAVCLNLVVAAMVVGQQQAFCRDDFACTASAKVDNGVFEAGLVYAVNIFCRELKAQLVHAVYFLSNEHGQPHAFVCPCRGNLYAYQEHGATHQV